MKLKCLGEMMHNRLITGTSKSHRTVHVRAIRIQLHIIVYIVHLSSEWVELVVFTLLDVSLRAQSRYSHDLAYSGILYSLSLSERDTGLQKTASKSPNHVHVRTHQLSSRMHPPSWSVIKLPLVRAIRAIRIIRVIRLSSRIITVSLSRIIRAIRVIRIRAFMKHDSTDKRGCRGFGSHSTAYPPRLAV